MDKEMKDVEQIHKGWDERKKHPLMIMDRQAYAAEHFDLLLNYIYDRDEYVAVLEKQIEDPTYLRDIDAFRPKDQTERQAFITLWCDRCKYAKEACSGLTHLMVLTEDDQVVDYDDLICMPNGQPHCTAFEVEEDAE